MSRDRSPTRPYRSAGTDPLFELEIELPDPVITARAARLIGFETRQARLAPLLRLMVDEAGLRSWSMAHHGRVLPLVEVLGDRTPLVVFHGDVGTGKTETAEALTNSLAAATGTPSRLFKLSTRVRGEGLVGQMGALITRAFARVEHELTEGRCSYLIVDEADSLTTARSSRDVHHEDKVAVNTMIQRIDSLRRFGGRALVILCTNRSDVLDPAVLRRCAAEEHFARPSPSERLALFELDLAGLGLDQAVLDRLVEITGGSDGLGFTFSDLRTRLIPTAVARAFPTRPVEAADLIEVASQLAPSPPIVACVAPRQLAW